jgi:uncharacterized protein (DUF983 family)
MAFCPRCKKDTVFVNTGRSRRCTACGLEFELTDPRGPESDWVGTTIMTIGHVLLRVVLIAGVIVVVGLAVLFASCAMHF